MSFTQHPFFQLSIGLLTGIILQYYFPIETPLIWLFVILWMILLWLWKLGKNNIIPPFVFPIFLFATMICLGFTLQQLQHPKNSETHFIHNNFEKHQLIELVILDVLKENHFQKRYLAKLKRINTTATSGKLLLSFQKDSIDSIFSADDQLLIYGLIQSLKAPQNPGQFNYKNYLENEGIFGQINTSKVYLLDRKKTRSSLTGRAKKTQRYLVNRLHKTSLTKENKSIVAALVLGDRKTIEKNLYEAYAAAGAIHILAVSGLHVGILFFILNILLKPLEQIFRKPFIKLLLMVLLLWVFAFITGLSPSVVRAVTMFSFFSVAQAVNRKNNSMNTLFISLFFILLVRPNWVFHIGFQLSYLAVFFILWLFPLFQKLYRSKWWVLQKTYTLICVSICAQIGVAPLSMYYFNQFPGLFLVSNLLLLPFLGLVLLYSLFITLLSAFEIHVYSLEIGLDHVISSINALVYWIADQNEFLFENIVLSKFEIISLYLLIVSLGLLWMQRHKRWIFVSLIALLFLITSEIQTSSQNNEKLIILHKNKHTIIANEHPKKVYVFHRDSSKVLNEWPLKNWRKTTYKSFIKHPLPKLFDFGEKQFLILDSFGVYPKAKGHYIVLTQNTKVNLSRLLDSLKPKMIIADGSNYQNLVQFWKKSCEEKRVPFHSTYENGALEFKKNL